MLEDLKKKKVYFKKLIKSGKSPRNQDIPVGIYEKFGQVTLYITEAEIELARMLKNTPSQASNAFIDTLFE